MLVKFNEQNNHNVLYLLFFALQLSFGIIFVFSLGIGIEYKTCKLVSIYNPTNGNLTIAYLGLRVSKPDKKDI